MSAPRSYRVVKVASSSTATVPTGVQPASLWLGANGAIAIIGDSTSAQYALSAQSQVISSLVQTTNPFLQAVNGATAVFVDAGGHAVRIRALVRNGLGALLRAVVYVSARPDIAAVTANGTCIAFVDAAAPPVAGTFAVIPDATGLVDVVVSFAAAGAKGVVLDFNGVQYFDTAFVVA